MAINSNSKSTIKSIFTLLVFAVQIFFLIVALIFLFIEVYYCIKGEENCAIINGLVVLYLTLKVVAFIKGLTCIKILIGTVEFITAICIMVLSYILYKSKPTRDIGRMLGKGRRTLRQKKGESATFLTQRVLSDFRAPFSLSIICRRSEE